MISCAPATSLPSKSPTSLAGPNFNTLVFQILSPQAGWLLGKRSPAPVVETYCSLPIQILANSHPPPEALGVGALRITAPSPRAAPFIPVPLGGHRTEPFSGHQGMCVLGWGWGTVACDCPSQGCAGLRPGPVSTVDFSTPVPSSDPAPGPEAASPAKASEPLGGSSDRKCSFSLTPPAVLSECLAHLSFLQGLPTPDALSQGDWLTGGGETRSQPPPPVCWGHKANADRIQGGLWQGGRGTGAVQPPSPQGCTGRPPRAVLHIHTSTPACPRSSLQAWVCSRT